MICGSKVRQSSVRPRLDLMRSLNTKGAEFSKKQINETNDAKRDEVDDLCVACVRILAAAAADGGEDSSALAGNEGVAPTELWGFAGGTAGYRHFRRVLTEGGSTAACKEIEVAAFDGGWSGAVELSRAA